ncbi:hypothetical protein [Leptolyngbya sp. PCC 6406]|uniref:hypothetical protein n=1 Tax=Leptolyngbya sp. PCC 6406 TaxID=1173264 RepID=UPI0002ABD673|nr:hypothetical protein [Leptolyngbya sp. PCC 6406]
MKVLLHTIGWAGLLSIAPICLGQTAAVHADESPLSVPEAAPVLEAELGMATVETGPASVSSQAVDLQLEPSEASQGDSLALPQAAQETPPRSLEAVSRSVAPVIADDTATNQPNFSLDAPALEPMGFTAQVIDSPEAAQDPDSSAPDSPEPEIPTAGSAATEAQDLFFELHPADSSRIPADSRSTLVLEGAITDAEGNPLDYDVVVTLTTSAGEFIEADYDSDRIGFQVLARRGQFQVTLRSSLEAQQVQVRAVADGFAARDLEPVVTTDPPPDLEAFTEVYFITDLRPTLVSGYVDFRLGAGGTNFWGSFRDFLNPSQIGTTQWDLNAGLFAIGTTGEWQFTGAFNTQRALNQTCDGNRLFRDTQFCDQTYPVYGDSSQSDFLTPSIDNFYLRFQRESEVPGAEPDYFMWGDYSTLEFARSSQQFTAVTRQLHGFKGNYTFGNFQVTAMYANNLRPFQRDTLAPDGTSGFYFLSRRAILPGSEDVFLEVEELNRPGTVLERRPLFRGADYEIDYDRGTLLFRQPVMATDVDPFGQTRVRRIVATYQVDGVGVGGNLYGARLQYNLDPGSDAAGWAGFTTVLEDQGIQQFRLAGVDVQLPLGESGRFIAELATSALTLNNQRAGGTALRLEALGTLLPGVVGNAYLSSTGSGFSNTATTSFRPGQTRWGAGVTANLGPRTQFRAQFDQETNVGTAPQVSTTAADLLVPGQYATPGSALDNTLTTLQIGVQQRLGTATVGLDFVNRRRSDRIAGISTSAQQLVPRLRFPIAPTLEFLAQSELNFGSESDPLYPTRTTLGLEWAVEPGVTVRLAQQFVSGGQQPRSVTSLDTIADYTLGDNTSLTSRYSILSGYGGLIGQSALGLNHRIVLAPGLRATLGFERVINDAFNNTGAGQQFAQPYAVGLGATALGLQAHTAYSLGVEYTNNPDFQASGRLEHRDSPSGNNTVLSLAAAGRITNALTTLFRYQRANYANQTITGRLGNSSSLKLGLAYRNPASDVFNALLSYEHRRNPATTPSSLLIDSGIGSTDHTFAFEGIYSPNWQWEFYGKYAFRVNNATLAEDFNFSSSIHLAQLRASYRFAYRWDVLGELRWITQPVVGFNEIGAALELGYYLTPDLRIGAGYSFGSVRTDGFGGSGDYRSAGGVYLGVQIKVNQLLEGFGLQTVAPAQQQESQVSPGTFTVPSPNLGIPAGPPPAASPPPVAPAAPPPAEPPAPVDPPAPPSTDGPASPAGDSAPEPETTLPLPTPANQEGAE